MNMCENGVIRPMSPEEIAELNRWQAEVPESEPTPDDRIAELEAQNQVLIRVPDGDVADRVCLNIQKGWCL